MDAFAELDSPSVASLRSRSDVLNVFTAGDERFKGFLRDDHLSRLLTHDYECVVHGLQKIENSYGR